MIETSLQYYCRRHEQELSLRAAAASPAAASAHHALALIYAEEIRRRISREPQLRLVSSRIISQQT